MKGKELPRLGWTGLSDLVRKQVNPITNGIIKPRGGLWTSPMRYDENGSVTGTGWTEWADSAWGSADIDLTEVVPEPDARIYVIDSLADLTDLVGRYPEPDGHMIPARVRAPIDWQMMVPDVDAVWLTDRGEIHTRFSTPSLYGWGCSTVFWLNPAFRVGETISIGAEA